MKSKINIRGFLKNIVYATRLIPNGDAFREAWIRKELATLKKGKSIIDVGAGEMIYKSSCQDLFYTSQDFGEYTGRNVNQGLQSGKFDARRIDIISDITRIPVKNASFDYVLCSEVFEHIPNPFEALEEISRIHKRGGNAYSYCAALFTYPFLPLLFLLWIFKGIL